MVCQQFAKLPLPKGVSGFESRPLRNYGEWTNGRPPRLGRGYWRFDSALSDELERWGRGLTRPLGKRVCRKVLLVQIRLFP